MANLPINNPAECAKELNRAVTKLGTLRRHVGGTGASKESRQPGVLSAVPGSAAAEYADFRSMPSAATSRAVKSSISSFACIRRDTRFRCLRQLTAMVFGGIPEMFPKLRIGYLEVGCGWLPYWAERMDEEWEKRGKVEAPLCKKKPSEYLFSENSYLWLRAGRKMIGYVVNEIGSKTLMYASDYPHWDMSWPESGTILWGREDISLDAKKDILLNNAKRFYNLL